MSLYETTVAQIDTFNRDDLIEKRIRERLDSLTKPQGSLGRLEQTVLWYGMAIGSTEISLPRKRIVVFAGDHGVVQEGVSAYPSSVTVQMVRNICAGGAAVNVLAGHVGAEVVVVDIGIADDIDGCENLVRKKIRHGTRNMLKEPAMSNDEIIAAIEVGIECAEQGLEDGITLLGTGEMGIGNTTPSAALFAALLPAEAGTVTGTGTGIGQGSLSHKTDVIEKTLKRHEEILYDPLRACMAVGGFEIAGICGLILGAARRRLPVVVDGFISTAGALVAARICPESLQYCLFSHCSAEKGHRLFFNTFQVEPLLSLDMRLGEGTGTALAMGIIDASIKIYNEMATCKSAGIEGTS